MSDRSTVKVVIIGAGACGLQCAHRLMTEYNMDPNDILILEARNRIGGRIHTTHETRIHDETKESIHFSLDHGACWVHGTGLDWETPLPTEADRLPCSEQVTSLDSTPTTTASSSLSSSTIDDVNPILPLLAKESDIPLYSQLDPIFQGNAWMRPKTIALDHKQLALFVQGRRLDNDPAAVSIIQESLRRHFALLETVSFAGQELFEKGQGMETLNRSVKDVLDGAWKELDGNDTKFIAIDSMTSDSSTTDAITAVRDTIQSLTPFFMHLLECWHGEPVKDLQLGAFVQEESIAAPAQADYDSEYSREGDFYGPHCLIKNGMETVLEPLLCDGVRERILLEQEVTRIRHVDGQHVTVETTSGRIVQASVCVSTLTVECLKAALNDNMFLPRLCVDKEVAISRTNMGSYKKIFLTFDYIFWPKDEAFIGLVHGRPNEEAASPLGKLLLLNNLWARKQIPCVEAILFGDSGSWATGKSDDQIRTVVLDFIKTAMKLDVDLSSICQSVHVTRWEEDRFTRGAYSNISLGASIRHVDELRRPEYDGRLWLAGEGTILEYEGSVHAALISGRETADRVSALLP